MKIIKLSAIDSTNSFLKELAQNTVLENGTTVVAETQLNGRGQMGTQWVSKATENLLCSVFFSFDKLPIAHQFFLNFAVSLSVYETVLSFNLPQLKIKWANDIMSENKKICGILIENVLQKGLLKSTVIGIGLNVNQETFAKDLPNASSIRKIKNQKIDIDVLLNGLLVKLEKNIQLLIDGKTTVLQERYLKVLYKKNIPMMFKNNLQNVLFMGMITGVTPLGKLQIQLEDESTEEFTIKEVSFASL